jgi:hypothetical protein
VREKLNLDDLMFAKVRAKFLEPLGQVTDRLIDAAGHPDRLDGVTRADTLSYAADVLVRAGEHQAAVDLLQRMLDDGTPDPFGFGRQMLARALIGAGRADEAEVIIRARSAVLPDPALAFWIAIVHYAEAGYYEQALRCADAIEELHLSYRQHDERPLRAAREKIQAMAHPDGLADAEPATGRALDGAGYTLWWPQTQYVRLGRQLPELAAAIGSPWRQHIAGVEAGLRGRARLGERGLRLVPAEFNSYVGFLMAADVDPRAKAAMDRFAQPGRETGDWLEPAWIPAAADTTAWPPQLKDRCWCSSGHRYKNCCGALAR